MHAFFVRIRGRRGHQIAAVATARKMAVLVWHLLAKEADYLWARPALVAHKLRALELQAGRPMKKGNRRGPAYAYNVKALRNREMAIAERRPNAPLSTSSASGVLACIVHERTRDGRLRSSIWHAYSRATCSLMRRIL